MKKKCYIKPEMVMVELFNQHALLAGSTTENITTVGTLAEGSFGSRENDFWDDF